MNEKDSSINISRTIYDPAIKDFITSTSDAKALPHIKEWINQHNPVIYWYILRIDNPLDASIDQWAVELYAHQALSITEVYVDGIDRRFEVRKRERDPWSEKYVLSIPRQVGIPIIGKGTRRIFFKVDIDCKEGLMHEYGISGAFMAQGMDLIEIKEKMFQYSCKVGEFRQIFDSNPDEASMYAEKRLSGKYLSNSVHGFINSFRMIHEMSNYCHSGSLNRDELLRKLHLLHASFEGVPEIAGERISPLIHDGIRELDIIVDRDKFAPRFIRLCDSLVELLHMEVMGAEVKDVGAYVSLPEPSAINAARTELNSIIEQSNMCPTCGNIISESNKSLICKECGTRFCTTCEEWFRKERKRGQKPLCEDCFTAEQERIAEERRQKEKKEQERNALEEAERKKQEKEKEKLQKEKEEQERKAQEEADRLERERKEKEEQEKCLKAEQEKKAREEAERKKREEEERKQRDEEKRLQKEKEEQYIKVLKDVKRKEREDKKRKRREEEERLQKEVEDKLQKEKEEQEKKAREEFERKNREKQEQQRKEEEERKRKRREEEERKRKRREEEEGKRKRREEEERLQKEVEDKLQKEKEEQEKKAREEFERKNREKQEQQRKEIEVQEKLTIHNSIGMKFIFVPTGGFVMGSDEYYSKKTESEKPAHKVTIGKPFYLGTYPVTQREWKAVMGNFLMSNNPSSFKGDDFPVETVSWDDVQKFIRKINKKEGTDKYRLPSEAEWEYACRAGTTTEYCFGDSESKLGEYAWYSDNSSSKTHPVGQKKPNPWDLYDMYGNVWEWVQDKWHNNYDGAPTDGSAWESGGGSSRVGRGGSWSHYAGYCRSAARVNLFPGSRLNFLGFRLLQEL